MNEWMNDHTIISAALHNGVCRLNACVCVNWTVGILNINFEPLTFCSFVCFINRLLVSVNVIDINMFKVLILCEMCYFCVWHFTRYSSNITNVWQEILMPMTLAFCGKVLHEKIWKSVNICKSYGEKISGTFFYVDCGHGVDFKVTV